VAESEEDCKRALTCGYALSLLVRGLQIGQDEIHSHLPGSCLEGTRIARACASVERTRLLVRVQVGEGGLSRASLAGQVERNDLFRSALGWRGKVLQLGAFAVAM